MFSIGDLLDEPIARPALLYRALTVIANVAAADNLTVPELTDRAVEGAN